MFTTDNRFTKTVFSIVLTLAIALGCLGGLTLSSFVPADNHAEAATSTGYYDSIDETLTGQAFYDQLATLITSTHHTQTSYNGLKQVYKTSDADPDKSGNIIWFYTGTSISYNGTLGSGSEATNREHVWPKNGGKAFTAESECGSDAHHLRPCNAGINGDRSNNQFNEVPQTEANIVAEGSSTSYANLCYQSGGTFYPGEGYRGATARILMYVQVRWGTQFNLSFCLGKGGNNGKEMGYIDTLMKWHLQEPPTEEEIRRNEVVYGIQGNRNPFIDHPEYASKIYCYDGESYNSDLRTVVNTYGDYGATDIESISFASSEQTVAQGATLTLEPTLTPADASRNIVWTSSDTSVATVDSNGVVSGIKSGSTVITATSAVDSSVSASVTVKVKGISAVAISGTAVITDYNEGQKFDPTGLTVTVTYSDGSSSNVSVSTLTWLDANTRKSTLSSGTTSVILSYGGLEQTYSGITVVTPEGSVATINRSSFAAKSGQYNWQTWTAGEIEGKAFMYAGNTSEIQMNNSKAQYYIFNTTPLTGGIVTFTVKTTSGDKKWELRTSSTPFDSTSKPVPTTGTSHGQLTVTPDGATWTISTTDQYFALCYADSKVVYLDSIEITYGDAKTPCEHTYGEWETVTAPTATTEGAKKRTCSVCGDIETEVIPALGSSETPCNHTYGEWETVTAPTATTAGSKKRTCSVCGNVETEVIPALGSSETPCNHTYGEWTTVNEPTETSTGLKKRVCSSCGNVENEVIPALGSSEHPCEHTYGEWEVVTLPTATAAGLKKRVCSSCGDVEVETVPALGGTAYDVAETFESIVEALGNATDLNTKEALIIQAQLEYNKLSETEKQTVATSYTALQQHIETYQKELTDSDSSNTLVIVLVVVGGVLLCCGIVYARSRRKSRAGNRY